MRAFRPARAAGGVPKDPRRVLTPTGSTSQAASSSARCSGSGELRGTRGDAALQQYPFVDLHGLLVPRSGWPPSQFLTRATTATSGGSTETLAERLPGDGLRLQRLRGVRLGEPPAPADVRARARAPRGAPALAHNGGEAAYPARCEVFGEAERPGGAWRALHRGEEPYNLLYRPGGSISGRGSPGHLCALALGGGPCLVRDERAGSPVFSRDDYERLDADANPGRARTHQRQRPPRVRRPAGDGPP